MLPRTMGRCLSSCDQSFRTDPGADGERYTAETSSSAHLLGAVSMPLCSDALGPSLQ